MFFECIYCYTWFFIYIPANNNKKNNNVYVKLHHMPLVSRFSMCLNCFRLIFFSFCVFVITCTTSDFLRFSSWRLRFSRLRSFFNSFSSCLAALIARDASFTLANSSRSFRFFTSGHFTPFVFIMEEKRVFSDFHIRPDFGLPLMIAGLLGVCFLKTDYVGIEFDMKRVSYRLTFSYF